MNASAQMKSLRIKSSIVEKINTGLIDTLINCLDLYFTHGARSCKKVDEFHRYIANSIMEFIKLKKIENIYQVKLEQKVSSVNSSGYKKCDIVVFKQNKPFIVMPVKLVMTNYKQNKNNYWETLTGELHHIKWAHEDNEENKEFPLNLIPINIYLSKTPYLDKSKKIKNFEIITNNDIKQMNVLIKKGITYDIINYIIDVKHKNIIGDNYTQRPEIVGYSENTPYRELNDILSKLIV